MEKTNELAYLHPAGLAMDTEEMSDLVEDKALRKLYFGAKEDFSKPNAAKPRKLYADIAHTLPMGRQYGSESLTSKVYDSHPSRGSYSLTPKNLYSSKTTSKSLDSSYFGGSNLGVANGGSYGSPSSYGSSPVSTSYGQQGYGKHQLYG